MGVVYKHGFYLGHSKKKMLVIGIALVLIGISLLIIKLIKGRQLSVQEHASTKLEPAIIDYKADGHCEGQTFVVKYILRINTPPMSNDPSPVKFIIKAFIPGVIKKDWITYVSGGGTIGGKYYISWSGKIPDNTTRDFVYTIALPGGTLQPGAEFKNVALLIKESGATEKRTASIIVNNCGVQATNPITPVPTTPVPTKPVENNIDNNQSGSGDNTITNIKNGLEDFVTNINNSDGSTITDNTQEEQQPNETNNTSTVGSTNTQENTNFQDNNYQTSQATPVPSYVTNPQYYNNASASNINTGIIDSPITAIAILIVGIIFKFVIKSNNKPKYISEESV